MQSQQLMGQSRKGTLGGAGPEASALLHVQLFVGPSQARPMGRGARVYVGPQHGTALCQDDPARMLPPGLGVQVHWNLPSSCPQLLLF